MRGDRSAGLGGSSFRADLTLPASLSLKGEGGAPASAICSITPLPSGRGDGGEVCAERRSPDATHRPLLPPERRSRDLGEVDRRSRAVGGTLLVLCSLSACAATPGEKMKADVTEFRKEGTPDKLFERGRAFAAVGDMTRAEEYLAAAMEAGYDE